MPLFGFLEWLRHGRPRRGAIVLRSAISVEEFRDAVGRTSRAFGDPAGLAVADMGSGDGGSPFGAAVLAAPWKRLVSVDDFLPSLNRLRAKGAAAAEHEVVEGRIEEVAREFPPGDVDVALALDVLHCLDRAAALATLRGLERAAGRGVVVFARLGAVIGEGDGEGNALDRGRSTWAPEDFARLGYDVEVYAHPPSGPRGADGAAWAIKRTASATPEAEGAGAG